MVTCKLGALELKTSLILGSCDLFTREDNLRKYYTPCVGAIVLKTTTGLPRAGNKQPHVGRLKDGILVSSGMANPGIEEMCNLARRVNDIPLIGSVAEIDLVSDYEKAGVLATELNLSCPNIDSDIPAQNPLIVYKAVKRAKERCSIPVFAKLTGWNCNLSETARAAQDAGADAIVVSNLFPGTGFYTGLVKQDSKYKLGECLVGRGYGAYTGRAFLSGVLLMIQQLKKDINIPIIATGGCCSDLDALVQTFMAGASAVETVTPLYQHKNLDKLYNNFLDWRKKNDF